MIYPRAHHTRPIVQVRIQPLPLWYARLRMRLSVRVVARWRDEVDQERADHDATRRGCFGVMSLPQQWTVIIQVSPHRQDD